MLFAESTKHCAGIKIFGDFLDLKNLHEIIHYLVDGVPIGGGDSRQGEFVLGLAYDVRHAYQGDGEMRKVRSFASDDHTSVTYGGFPSLWPYILPQIGLLRWSAAFHSTTRSHQATLFAIEGCIEETLYSVDRVIGKEVFDWLMSFSGLSSDYYIQFIEHCAFLYVTKAKAGRPRFRTLPRILHMMAPWSDEYKEFATDLEATAKESKCDPHELADRSEWPDFRW